MDFWWGWLSIIETFERVMELSNAFDMLHAQLSRQLQKLVVGQPSNKGSKATGMKYSEEYFSREAASPSRTDFHRLSAWSAHAVLTSDTVQNAITQAIDEVVNGVVERAKANAPMMANDEAEQDALEKKVEADKKKVTKAARKPATKTTPAKRATASTRKTTKTAAKPRTKAAASKSSK